MGGRITIIERKNGEILSIDGYTSNIEKIQDIDYLNQTLSSDDAFIKLERKKGNEGLFPNDYGLVVIDFDNKWVGHIQGYSEPSGFSDLRLTMGAFPVFLKAFHAGAIKKICVKKIEDDPAKSDFQDILEPLVFNGASYLLDTDEKVLEWLKKGDYRKHSKKGDNSFNFLNMDLVFFKFEPKDWAIERFEESSLGYFEFFTKLIEYGFPVNLVVNKWKSFVKDLLDKNDENVEQDVYLKKFDQYF